MVALERNILLHVLLTHGKYCRTVLYINVIIESVQNVFKDKIIPNQRLKVTYNIRTYNKLQLTDASTLKDT